MLKGGYLIIDLKEKVLSGTKVVIPGIYDSIEGNYGKPTLISGLVVNSIVKPDFYTIIKLDGDNFVIDAYGVQITINDDDEVTLAGHAVPDIPVYPEDPDATTTYTLKLTGTVSGGKVTWATSWVEDEA